MRHGAQPVPLRTAVQCNAYDNVSGLKESYESTRSLHPFSSFIELLSLEVDTHFTIPQKVEGQQKH